jgi:hypothetical protein
VAGAVDALTSQADVLAYAAQVPHATVHTLPGSHCLPLEYPDRIMDMLHDLHEDVQEHRARLAYRAGGTAAPVVDLRARSDRHPERTAS